METTVGEVPAVEKDSSIPPYQQIEAWLLEAIANGELSSGDRLPPERVLARAFQVSRMTLRHALGALEVRGLVTRVLGRNGGTFIQGRKIACDLNQITGFTDQLRSNGHRPGSRLLEAVETGADEEVAKALEIGSGAPVYRIIRLRLADEQPVAIERSWFPAERFRGLLKRDLNGSIYALLDICYGERPIKALETLEAVRPTREQAQLLGISGPPVAIQIERIAYSFFGSPVEYARDIFRGDRTKLTLWSGLGVAL